MEGGVTIAHSMAYSICGVGASNMQALKNAGFIDFHYVVPGGSSPASAANFVAACNSNGVSPIFNNGNDGIPGASGYDYNSYYQQVANLGWHAAGGESEQADEISNIMANLPFMNYGGEYGGCDYNFSDIFAHGAPSASGRGIASYLETYIGVAGIGLCPSQVVAAMVSAHNHGCQEVGIMIGVWMGSYGAGAQDYINIINSYESQSGVACSGVCLWGGYDYDMNTHYNQGSNPSIIATLQQTWPPNMTTLKDRFAGGGVTPPGPPGPPPSQIPDWAKTFPSMSEIDITQYLTSKHDGQPTPGQHSVEIVPVDGTAHVNAHVRVREKQPRRE